MIYKFIDENGSEITVNSLLSLQALVESNTIKKTTKIKAGLRGKWSEAATIEELEGFFEKKEKEQSSPEMIVEEAEIQSDIEKEKVLVEEEKVPEHSEDEEIKSLNETEKEEKKPQVETVFSIEEDHTKEEVKKKTEEESTEKLGLGLYDDYNLVPINFFDSINICFTKFFNFKDRASRSEYWWFYLFFWVVIFLAAFSESFKDSYLSILFGLVILIAWIPLISVSVRRLHDVNKSGWYFFISIIPYLGPLFFLFFTLEKGTLGNNNYGKFPLQFKDPNLRDNSDEIQSDSYSNEDSSENLMDNINQNRADRAESEAQAIALRNSKEYILRKKEKQKKEWIIAGSILFLIIIFFYFSNTKTEVKSKATSATLQEKTNKENPKKIGRIGNNKKISDNEILFDGNTYKYTLEDDTNQKILGMDGFVCIRFESLQKILIKCANKLVADYAVIRNANESKISFSYMSYIKKKTSKLWFKKRTVELLDGKIQVGRWVNAGESNPFYGAYNLDKEKWLAAGRNNSSKTFSDTNLSQVNIDKYIRQAKTAYKKASKNQKEFEELFAFFLSN
jgi:uncharacterized membrane protein YhaH (DUF805 family)